MIPFNYHHLYYVYTIARLGSVSKASEVLRLGQPTLSTQIKQFEGYLNLKLFERQGKKRLTLTEEGRRILSYAKEIFETGQEMIDNLGDLSHKGRIRIQIGAPDSVPKSFLDALLQFILKIAPKTYLYVQEDRTRNLIEHLKTNFLDIVLTDTPAGSLDEQIESHLVGKIPIVFCAHTDLARKYRSIPKDLDKAPLILPTAHSQIHHALQEYFIEQKIKPDIVAEVQDVELARRLVLSKVGIAPLNLLTIKKAPSKEPLVVIGKPGISKIYEKIYILVKKRLKPHPLVSSIVTDFKITV